MRLTFVGTGVSCAIPVIGHISTSCACRDAIRHPGGPNRRNNVALLISLPFPTSSSSNSAAEHEVAENNLRHRSSNNSSSSSSEEVEWHHVLIDCGKTFRDAYLRVLAPMRVRFVDALLLTHGHADAMHCVEELCGLQAEAARDLKAFASSASSSRQAAEGSFPVEEEGVGEIPRTLRRIPTYLTYPTLEQIEMVSRDLARSSLHVGLAPASQETYAQMMQDTDNAISSYAAETSVFSAPDTVLDLLFLNEEAPQRIFVPIGPLAVPSDSAPGHAPSPPRIGSPNTHQLSQPTSMQAEAELPFYSFPVEHGPKYISMCFAFGHGIAFKSHQRSAGLPSSSSSSPASPLPLQPPGSCVVYISDVSSIPANSMAFLLDLVKIDVLILDLLAEHGSSSASHYCADEAIPMVVQLAPRRTYFVGMFCSIEHHSMNTQLAQELVDLKAQLREELDRTPAQSTCSPEEAALRAQKRRFLDETVSMELAFDGQQLDIDA